MLEGYDGLPLMCAPVRQPAISINPLNVSVKCILTARLALKTIRNLWLLNHSNPVSGIPQFSLG